MGTKLIPRTEEQEVNIPNCALRIIGQINKDSLFGQRETTETFIDRCVAVDRMLTYNVGDDRIEIIGCVGCHYYTGKEK